MVVPAFLMDGTIVPIGDSALNIHFGALVVGTNQELGVRCGYHPLPGRAVVDRV
jgi:hypothetical protein